MIQGRCTLVLYRKWSRFCATKLYFICSIQYYRHRIGEVHTMSKSYVRNPGTEYGVVCWWCILTVTNICVCFSHLLTTVAWRWHENTGSRHGAVWGECVTSVVDYILQRTGRRPGQIDGDWQYTISPIRTLSYCWTHWTWMGMWHGNPI